MNYILLKDVIDLVQSFEVANHNNIYKGDIDGFKQYVLAQTTNKPLDVPEIEWEGKANGRSPESVISTLLVHLNRYAKAYSKSAIWGSDFSTQEEFIYLINLKAFGAMTKMELIKKNIQEKPVGMQIISRLIKHNWIEQSYSELDKRSKIIRITEKGLQALELQMHKIRQATNIVTGDLSQNEKMELIRLLDKLDRFHHNIFSKNIDASELLESVAQNFLPSQT